MGMNSKLGGSSKFLERIHDQNDLDGLNHNVKAGI